MTAIISRIQRLLTGEESFRINLPPVGVKAHYTRRVQFKWAQTKTSYVCLDLVNFAKTVFYFFCSFQGILNPHWYIQTHTHFACVTQYTDSSLFTHHTVPVVSPVSIEVGQVTVFVPPGTTVGQGTVAEGNVIIWVNSSPGPALVVGHSITWRS